MRLSSLGTQNSKYLELALVIGDEDIKDVDEAGPDLERLSQVGHDVGDNRPPMSLGDSAMPPVWALDSSRSSAASSHRSSKREPIVSSHSLSSAEIDSPASSSRASRSQPVVDLDQPVEDVSDIARQKLALVQAFSHQSRYRRQPAGHHRLRFHPVPRLGRCQGCLALDEGLLGIETAAKKGQKARPPFGSRVMPCLSSPPSLAQRTTARRAREPFSMARTGRDTYCVTPLTDIMIDVGAGRVYSTCDCTLVWGRKGGGMVYEKPVISDFGSIADHTFMPVPPGSATKSHKGFENCRVETENCELSSPS